VIPIATLAELNLEWKLWKRSGRDHWNRCVCLFLFTDYKAKAWHVPTLFLLLILGIFLRICYQQVTCMIIYGTDDTISTYAVICSFDGNYKKCKCFRFNGYIHTKMLKHHTENNSETSECQFNCSYSCFVSLFHNSCHYSYCCIFTGFY
jgi:hypothetical protein